MRKAHLFNQENKMKLINQQLYKRRRIAFKKLRIQQLQQQQQPINININTGFETNRRIKEIYKKLELLTPQERITPTPIRQRRAAPPPVPQSFREDDEPTTMPYNDIPQPAPRETPEARRIREGRTKVYVRSPTQNSMVVITGKAGKERLRMDTEAGRTTIRVESVLKPDFV